jgi:hypothetical protein
MKYIRKFHEYLFFNQYAKIRIRSQFPSKQKQLLRKLPKS